MVTVPLKLAFGGLVLLLKVVVDLLTPLLVALYTVARVYLVVECFSIWRI